MTEINKFIAQQKIEYYKIKSIRSIVFLNQKIFFNNIGFKHLTQKGRYNRTIADQKRRLKLLIYVRHILQDVYANVEYRQFTDKNSTTHLYGVTSIIYEQKIKIVIRKINDGRLIFLSIMNNKKNK